MSDELTIVVPTRDGAPYAFVIADAYRRAGLSPLFLVDGRSSRQYQSDALERIESAAILEDRKSVVWGKRGDGGGGRVI